MDRIDFNLGIRITTSISSLFISLWFAKAIFFIFVLQEYLTVIVRLTQWLNPNEYGWIDHILSQPTHDTATTKQRTKQQIFHGMYFV